MNDTNARLAVLLRRFLENTCTRPELQELLEMIARQPDSDMLRLSLEEQWKNVSGAEGISNAQEKLEELLRKTRPLAEETNINEGKKIRGLWPAVNRWPRVAVAAAFVLVLASSYYLYFMTSSSMPERSAGVSLHDVPPGSERAILTLADGREILLDSAGAGTLAKQGNTRILKLDKGALAYEATDQSTLRPHAEQYNTLATPHGGQFRVILPDGTQVWLNAASSLRYPAAFTGSRREVELTGEAYFEVATQSRHSSAISGKIPFIVRVNGMEVEVLGTHFNINAYENEEHVTTTLLEGSVAVTAVSYAGTNNGKKKEDRKLLKPGQQAQMDSPRMAGPTGDREIRIFSDVNTRAATGWKNGYFLFEHSSLAVVMRQLERWYDIEVVYQGAVPEQYFGGRIPRDLSLSKVTTILEQSGVQFKISGRQLIVLE